MSYENAPATKMLNTHCCACARPLVDAASVTAGLGPECRKKHGVPTDLPEDVRERANKLIYECAREDVGLETLQAAVVELALLGCAKLADRISKRAGRLVLTFTDEHVDVTAPYNETFLRHRGPGRWVRDAKVTRYHKADANAALFALREAFSDVLVRIEHEDGSPVFLTLTSDRLTGLIGDVIADAPAKPQPKSPCPVNPDQCRWQGTPTRTQSGQWGVKIMASADAEPGDTVRVRTRGGKVWAARLTKISHAREWGQVWRTARV